MTAPMSTSVSKMAQDEAGMTSGNKSLKSVIAKIHQSSQKDAEFYDVAESSGGLNKLNVTVYPRMELIDFYGDYPVPDSNYSPQSVKFRTDAERLTEYRQEVKLQDALKHLKDGTLTVVGPAGSGKSTLLKGIARAVISGQQEVLADVDIVHFLQGKDLHSAEKRTSFKLLLHNVDLDQEEVEIYLRFVQEHPYKVLFIIDSLDTFPYQLEKQSERIGVREKANPGTIIWNLLIGNIFRGCKIITSSREYTIRAYRGKLRAKNIVALAGLTKESIEKIIHGYFPDGYQARKILNRLSKSPSLENLCSIPVFLSFTLVGFNVKAPFDPRTMTGILVLVLHSLVRSDHRHVDNIAEVIHKLKALAMEGTRGKRVLFSTDELAAHELKEDVVTDLTILAPGLAASEKFIKKECNLFFNHQSLQELLSAYSIAEMDQEKFEKFLRTEIHTQHYAVVRRILCGIILDEEIESASQQFFTGKLDSDRKRLLIESLTGQLASCEDEDALELLLSFHEAGSAMDEAIQSNLPSVDLRRVTFSPGDMYAVGSVISRCKHLKNLNIPFSNLNTHLLDVLNSSIQSNVKIDAIDVSCNNTMGVEGIGHLGEIVRRCQITRLCLNRCDLTPEQLNALKKSLGNAKVETLIVSNSRAMGKEGYSRIGEIVKNCDVATIGLIGCKFTGEELTALKTSMGSSKIKRLVGAENGTWLLASSPPIEEICTLLSQVTEAADLTGLVVKNEDIETVQHTLDRLQRQGLEVRVGPTYDYQKLEAGKPRQARSTTELSTQSSVQPDEIDLTKYDEASEVVTIKAEAGGAVDLFGCTLKVPPHKLEKDSVIKVTVSNEGSSVPDQYRIISPTFTCAVQGEDNVVRPEGDFQLAITSWCSADTPFKVSLLKRTGGMWQRDRTLILGKERRLGFKASTFSQWVLAFEPTTDATRVLRYRIHTCVCYSDVASYLVHCSIDDEYTIHRINNKVRKFFKSALSWQEPQSVKTNDVVHVEMSPTENCPKDCVFDKNVPGFEFHGVFISTCCLVMEFRLKSLPEYGKHDCLEFLLKIRKNSGLVEKEAKFRIPWPEDESVSRERHESNQHGCDEVPDPKLEHSEESLDEAEEGSTVDAGVPGTSHVNPGSTTYIQNLRGNIEARMKQNVKKRCHIGPDGGTVELCACSVIFPPGALNMMTPVDLEVGSSGKNLPEGYVAFTPIFSCSISGNLLHKPVIMTLPAYCIMESGTFVVLTKKERNKEWIAIEKATLNGEDFTIEMEIGHFCQTGGFMEWMLSWLSPLMSTGKVTIVYSLFYDTALTSFYLLVNINDEKTKRDCLHELNIGELTKVTKMPLPLCVKTGDIIMFKIGNQDVASRVEAKKLLDRKYDVMQFQFPTEPNSEHGTFNFTFSTLVNGKLEREDALVLRVPFRPVRTHHEGSRNIRSATASDYNAHLGSDSIYQFPRDRRKGRALIINNYRFTNDPTLTRVGSDADVNRLLLLWTQLGLECTVRTDLTVAEMQNEIDLFIQNCSNISLCVAVVMSHGNNDSGDDILVGKDGDVVRKDALIGKFDEANCPNLKGIPKLIFLQYCRGNQVDSDNTDATREGDPGNINSGSSIARDRVVVYATQPNYRSFRDRVEGSWFINALVRVFANQAHNTSVQEMVCHVHRAVTERRAERWENGRAAQQTGEEVGNLLKTLYLFPGWP